MAVSDDLQERIEHLQNQPTSGVEERAEGEEGAILESGRTVGDLLDLLVELRDVTVSVWENDELERLPHGLKQNLSGQVQRLVDACQHYAQKQNQAQDLETRVDQLHAFLWQNNLIDRPKELSGYERKYNRLESLKRKSRRIIKELQQGLENREHIEALREEAEHLKKQASDVAQKIQETLDELAEKEGEAQEKLQQIRTSSEEVSRVEQQAEKTLSRAKNSADEVGTKEKEITTFFEEIQDARTELDQIKEDTRALVERNEDLEQQVEDQLQRATGAALFQEFDKRRTVLGTAKWIWAGFSVLSLVGTVVWSVFLANSAADPDAVFYVKLGGTVPLLAVVVFCLSQYGRERRAEEEYAFKSALSLSLVPYKELVEDLETSQQDAEYAKFLTRTIGQIYESPRLSSKLASSDDEFVSLGAVKKVTEIVERVVNR